MLPVFLPGPAAVLFGFEDGAVLEGEDVAGDVQVGADAVGDEDCNKAVSPPSIQASLLPSARSAVPIMLIMSFSEAKRRV